MHWMDYWSGQYGKVGSGYGGYYGGGTGGSYYGGTTYGTGWTGKVRSWFGKPNTKKYKPGKLLNDRKPHNWDVNSPQRKWQMENFPKIMKYLKIDMKFPQPFIEDYWHSVICQRGWYKEEGIPLNYALAVGMLAYFNPWRNELLDYKGERKIYTPIWVINAYPRFEKMFDELGFNEVAEGEEKEDKKSKDKKDEKEPIGAAPEKEKFPDHEGRPAGAVIHPDMDGRPDYPFYDY